MGLFGRNILLLLLRYFELDEKSAPKLLYTIPPNETDFLSGLAMRGCPPIQRNCPRAAGKVIGQFLKGFSYKDDREWG